MIGTALASLPDDWQSWIAENLRRSCDPVSLAGIMVRDGRFDPVLANAAIAEASAIALRTPSGSLEMPDIDTRLNSLQTFDRTIDVLFNISLPRIVLLGNVLSENECDALSEFCAARLGASPVVNDGDGSSQIHTGRTSLGAMIEREETELVSCVEARLAQIASWPIEKSEGMQIQQYQPGNEYRPHFDWFDPDLSGPRGHMENGGQRLATFVIYLSDVECGGATSFPTIGLEVQPKKGNAIFFQNTDNLYVPDRRTLHAGNPVVRGVKTIANKWLRERKY